MKVDNPTFDEIDGEVECEDCPFDDGYAFSENCRAWWYRNGDTGNLDCPNAENYAEACALAYVRAGAAVEAPV